MPAWSQPGVQITSQDVRQAPPPYSFDGWRMIEEAEFSRVYEISFTSAYTTGVAENDKVRVKCWMPHPPKAPLPSVILLHYLGATDTQMEEGLARRLNDRGIAAFIMPLPYHLSRTPAGKRSGQEAIKPDPAALTATMKQATLDVRRLLDFISERPEFSPTMIGLSGTSLGSIIGSLVFAVDERIKISAFTLGGIDLAHILMKSPIVQVQREELRKKGWTEESLREALLPIEPTQYLKPLGADRRSLVIAAKYDQVIPRSATDKLVAKLETAVKVELSTGHYGGFVVQNRILRTLTSWFDASLRDKDFKAPRSLDAPTLRIGVAYNPESSAQVALAFDVWRSGDRFFAAPMITPKGIQGFFGASLTREASIGVSVTGRRTTWGIYWNYIL